MENLDSGFRKKTVERARKLLVRRIKRSPRFRRLAERSVAELERALVAPDLYGSKYFEPKSSSGGVKASGYAEYTREKSNLDVAAYVVYKHLKPQRLFDVGSATGFLLEALAELGIQAYGADLSPDAVHAASDSVRPRMVVASATNLPLPDGAAPVVTAFETFEHIPPRLVPVALKEVFRVCSGFVVATIPSFGHNDYGPNGWYQGKVRWEVLEQYLAKDESYEGPIPFYDLMRDDEGNPIEGHVTIASFSWWTKMFGDAGFIRTGEVEERMNEDLGRFGLLGDQIWHLYVFRKPGTDVPTTPLARPDEIQEAESLLRLPSP